MSTQLPTTFTRYQLSEKEILQGSLLTDLQLQVIQNMRVDIAESKLALHYDPLNPISFAQQEADLTGRLAILDTIIYSNESAKLASQHQ